MNVVKTRLGTNGRLVILKEICNQLGLKEGDLIQVGVEDGIIIFTPKGLLEEFYDLTENLRASGVDVVQDLIDERRAEARLE